MRHTFPLTILLLALTMVVVDRVNTSTMARGSKPVAAQGPACSISFPLPNASAIGSDKFETLLYRFLEQGCYKNWVPDREIRNSGPFINGKSFGTHSAVKVFYSPEVWDWMKHRNRQGEIADGGMIVKEMFPSPAKQDAKLNGWTVMVKDKKGAHDGWYWSYHAPNYAPENPAIEYPDSGFGLYCLRCHASAEKESTFITLKNVEGDPISFVVRVPTMSKQPAQSNTEHEQVSKTKQIIGGPFGTARKTPEPNFVNLFKGLPLVPAGQVQKFPGESFDHVVAEMGGPKGFLTSSQCMGCHSASKENMAFLFEDEVQPPLNFSPYTEWRASMMGLAGRDPIFHAQLESEKALRPSQAGFLDNTCYRCHGVMGQRQVELDKQQPFKHSMVFAMPDEPDGKYGALARDGVSCAVCHRISKEDLGKESTFTGKFKLDPPDVANGQYKDNEIITQPMKNATGITPRFGEHVKTSALCGSCHTVVLPVLDERGKPVLDKKGKPKEFYEQTTYPEWVNSVYQNEREPIDRASVRTCQDCHMPAKFLNRPLVFRVANIEDTDYPHTEGRLPDRDITVRVRDQYSRHTLVGINQFGLMMFAQFPDILGIRTTDYMYGEAVPGLLTAQSSGYDLARRETATIAVNELKRTDKTIEARVEVKNLAGHNLPSGVAFRRAFISFEALDAAGQAVWASGRTNSSGAIVKGTSEDILPTEFFYDPVTRKQVLQPHHETISDEGQVQIYEEIIADTKGKITTSFVGLDKVLKSNRLLPKGWRKNGPFAEHTSPHGEAEHDPEYINPTGATGGDLITYSIPINDRTRNIVSVRVMLHYQAIPPYYLKERFTIGKGPDTQRLAYIASHLTLQGTPIENWKLALACGTRRLEDQSSQTCQQW